MKVWKLFLSLSIFLSSTVSEDTVSEDIGVHQLERLVEMLTTKECENLLKALTHTEEGILNRLWSLSPENNELDLKPRVKRDSASADDKKAACRTSLTDWLLRHGEQIYYDRLTRALQHIGRADIAVGVGENINQDKALKLMRYVEGYHKYVSSLNFPSVQPDQEDQPEKQGDKKRDVKDLTWRDLDLIVERAPVPPYQKGPLDVALPLLYGVLLGFGGSLLAVLSVFFFVIRSHSPHSHW